MTDCFCHVGQKCHSLNCGEKGEPSRDVPGSAWCAVHAALPHEERVRIWQQAVLRNEERERAGH